jgi:hypothetical protein
MEKIINIFNNNNNIRLVDVFITGPLQIYISTLLKNIFFKYFMLITGLLNIIFNGYVYLLESKYIKKKHPYLKHIITENGKTQIHRLYNLIVMYPIFLCILLNFKLPSYLQLVFLINIIIGFIFNLYNFVSIDKI